jgi:hypothetical protein
VAFPAVVNTASSVEATDTTTHDVPLPSGSGGWLLLVAAINSTIAGTTTRRAPQGGRTPALYYRALLREDGTRQVELARI